QLIDDEAQVGRNGRAILRRDMLGMDRNVSVARPLQSEVAVAEAGVAKTVREDDHGHWLVRRFRRVNVEGHMTLPSRIEPVDIVLNDSMRTGMSELRERRIRQRAARNG